MIDAIFGLTEEESHRVQATLDEISPVRGERIEGDERQERIRYLAVRLQLALGLHLFYRERKHLALVGMLAIPATLVFLAVHAFR